MVIVSPVDQQKGGREAIGGRMGDGEWTHRPDRLNDRACSTCVRKRHVSNCWPSVRDRTG